MLRACEARAVVINAHPHSLVMQPSDEHLIETTHAFGICNRGCTIECDLCDRFVTFDILLRESCQLMEFATENTSVYVEDHFGGRIIFALQKINCGIAYCVADSWFMLRNYRIFSKPIERWRLDEPHMPETF